MAEKVRLKVHFLGEATNTAYDTGIGLTAEGRIPGLTDSVKMSNCPLEGLPQLRFVFTIASEYACVFVHSSRR
jgi:hypothetical protein